MCICLYTQRPAVGVRQYGAGFQVGPLEEREVLTTAEPSYPVACWFVRQHWLGLSCAAQTGLELMLSLSQPQSAGIAGVAHRPCSSFLSLAWHV